MSLWIKICANTTLADAQLAANAGADAVGFVFAPSPRQITPAQAASIIPHLPATLEKIGVFVDASFDDIASTVETAGLTGVQLHFEATPELSAELRARFGPGLRILHVVHFGAEQNTRQEGALSSLVSGHDFSHAETDPLYEKGAFAPEGIFSDCSIDAVLVDSRTATAVGGTGKTFDWHLAATTVLQNAKARERLVAAGGLTPDNVAEAIAVLHPWGVDVVSGVESVPGRKDHTKVRDFIANARAASKPS
ncbi:MAG: phosphoribosylanthranilate isomerase [Terracidiphilus sp.]